MVVSHRKRVVLIVPCFNERDVLPEFFRRVDSLASAMPAYDLECLYVDDGSSDGTNDLLWQRALVDGQTRVITLTRNFGHQAAITAGIDHGNGDMTIVLDADLQDPPERVIEMVEALEDGADVVHMVRSQRLGEGRLKRWSAYLFYRYMARFSFVRLPEDAGDFKGFSRRAVEGLRKYPERVRFLRGVIGDLGLRQVCIDYVRDARHAGRSKYPWRRVLRLATDAVLSHSPLPMRLVMGTGLVSLPLAVVALVALGFTAGAWAAAAVVFYGGLILAALGLAGEYLVRILLEVKGRPVYLVQDRMNLEAPSRAETQKESLTR